MTNDQIVISVLQNFQNTLEKKSIKEKQSFECLKIENLNSIINKVQYIGQVCASSIQCTLIGYNGWSKQKKAARSNFGATGSPEQQHLSIKQLKQISKQASDALRQETVEFKHYFFARHLQLFFNNTANWTEWQKKLKSDPAKSRELLRLKKLWFSQNHLAITPTKILIQIKNKLDAINEYLEGLRFELKNGKNPEFEQQIMQIIQVLENYGKSIQRQLEATAHLRLMAASTTQMPDRDNVVNDILQQLQALDITTGKISDITASTQLFNQLQFIRVKNKKPITTAIKGNTDYILSNFSPTEIYFLENEEYQALQAMAGERKIPLSSQLQHAYNPVSQGCSLAVVQSPEGKTMYYPENISVPTQKPKFYKLFSVEDFHYTFAQKQAMTLKFNYIIEKNDLSIKILSLSDFDKSNEKNIFDAILRLQKLIEKQQADIHELSNNNYRGILYWRRRVILNKWAAFYEERINWTDKLLNKWLKGVLSPKIEPLFLKKEEVEKALKYYNEISQLIKNKLIDNKLKIALERKIKELTSLSAEYDRPTGLSAKVGNSYIVAPTKEQIMYVPNTIQVPLKKTFLPFTIVNFSYNLAKKQQGLLNKIFHMIKSKSTNLSTDDLKIEDAIKAEIKGIQKQIKNSKVNQRNILQQWAQFYLEQLKLVTDQLSKCNAYQEYKQQQQQQFLSEMALFSQELENFNRSLEVNRNDTVVQQNLTKPIAPESAVEKENLNAITNNTQSPEQQQKNLKNTVSESKKQILAENDNQLPPYSQLIQPINQTTHTEKKVIDLYNLTDLERNLPKLLESQQSPLNNREVIKYWLRMTRHSVIQLNAYLQQSVEEQNAKTIHDRFETLSRWVAILGMINQKSPETYTQSLGAVLQKITHLYINVLTKFEYQSDVAQKAQALLEQAKTQLDHSSYSETLPMIKQELKDIHFYGEITKIVVKDTVNLEPSATKQRENNLSEAEEEYKKPLQAAQEKQDIFLLKKNVKKLFLEKNIEDKIETYLQDKLNKKDVMDTFKLLTKDEEITEKYIKEHVFSSMDSVGYMVTWCSKEKLWHMIKLSRYIDRHRSQLCNTKEWRTSELREIIKETKRLMNEAFPETKQPIAELNTFFKRKFGMVNGMLQENAVVVTEEPLQQQTYKFQFNG